MPDASDWLKVAAPPFSSVTPRRHGGDASGFLCAEAGVAASLFGVKS